MTIEDEIAFLERIPTLRWLGPPALRILAIGAEGYRLEPGQVLFTAARLPIAPMRSRKARSRSSLNGAKARLSPIPARCSANPHFLAEIKRPATATAREPSAVLRISRTVFRKMLEGYPEAAHRLRELIAARADQWARDIENVRDALAPRNRWR